SWGGEIHSAFKSGFWLSQKPAKGFVCERGRELEPD
ncbi:DNA repair protein RadA, partial [Helicobacter pylori]